MRTIYIIFLLSCFIFGQSIEQDKWITGLLKNPATAFSNNYEKHLFSQFRKKFSNLKVENIVKNDKTYILQLDLGKKQTYHLSCVLNDQFKIKRIYRDLPFLKSREYSVSDRIIIKWIGRFFYHLDSGDKEAMYDLIFHNDTKLIYNKITDKKQIIQSLLNDFPRTIKPREIEIRSSMSKYRVGIYVFLSADLFLEINSKLANITDTDELQENLYLNLERAINKAKDYSENKEISEKIKTIINSYPNAALEGDTLLINYPELGLKALSKIRYLLKINKSGIDISSIIHLKTDASKSTLFFNKSYPLSFYKNPNIKNNYMWEIEKAIGNLFTQFICLPFLQKNFLSWQLSGEVKYRGYLYHDLIIKNTKQWSTFWAELKKEGAIYFYPSSVDISDNEMIIHGLVYILKDGQMNFYHFGELLARYTDFSNLNKAKIELNFYPFLSRVGVKRFDEE